jgi:enterochelin esterase-like enzyme
MQRSHRWHRFPRRGRTVLAVAVLVLAAAGLAGPPGADAAPSSRHFSPQVVHTGSGPTGYEVTFRFKDPAATSVKLEGEWYFTNPYELPALTSGPDSNVQTTGTLPSQWRPGDIPISYPNSSFGQWPVVEMTKGHHGIWTYTTPLPSGVFNYAFYVDCAPTDSGCNPVPDPDNPPWNQDGGTVVGSAQSYSQVDVPSDPRFGTVDLSWQLPNPTHGTLTDVTFPSSTSVPPDGHDFLAVYTPPGYDPQRSTPYPTVYMFTGGDNEMDWSTQGDLGNILDNLIDAGEIAPMVVVMPNTLGETTDYDGFPAFDANLVNSIVPYVESRYNVSTSASQRAAAGQGFGGSITESLLFNYTNEFGYYGIMSPGSLANFTTPDPPSVGADQVAAMRKASIFVGGGWQEPSVTPTGTTGGGHYYHAEAVRTFVELGLPVTPDFVNGGHSWYTWRLTVKDFLTRVAFFPPVAG